MQHTKGYKDVYDKFKEIFDSKEEEINDEHIEGLDKLSSMIREYYKSVKNYYHSDNKRIRNEQKIKYDEYKLLSYSEKDLYDTCYKLIHVPSSIISIITDYAYVTMFKLYYDLSHVRLFKGNEIIYNDIIITPDYKYLLISDIITLYTTRKIKLPDRVDQYSITDIFCSDNHIIYNFFDGYVCQYILVNIETDIITDITEYFHNIEYKNGIKKISIVDTKLIIIYVLLNYYVKYVDLKKKQVIFDDKILNKMDNEKKVSIFNITHNKIINIMPDLEFSKINCTLWNIDDMSKKEITISMKKSHKLINSDNFYHVSDDDILYVRIKRKDYYVIGKFNINNGKFLYCAKLDGDNRLYQNKIDYIQKNGLKILCKTFICSEAEDSDAENNDLKLYYMMECVC